MHLLCSLLRIILFSRETDLFGRRCMDALLHDFAFHSHNDTQVWGAGPLGALHLFASAGLSSFVRFVLFFILNPAWWSSFACWFFRIQWVSVLWSECVHHLNLSTHFGIKWHANVHLKLWYSPYVISELLCWLELSDDPKWSCSD